MESLESGPVLLSVGFIGFFSITLFVRRWLASRRSGGSPHFEWHLLHSCAFVFQPSYDPIERDEADNLLIAPGSRWWWESLCFLYRTQKWKDHSLLFR